MNASFLESLSLSRYAIDRDYLAREDDELIARMLADANTRVLPIFRGEALMAGTATLRLIPPADVPPAALTVYLGRSLATNCAEPVGTPIFAALLEDAGQLVDAEWGNLRIIGDVLNDRDVGMFTEALGIVNWHQSHRFSPKTGVASVVGKAGWVRLDPTSGAEIYPRTDAAIIVGITDDHDRLLLGSNALWESNRFSLLAGFVEPGESLENAVVREVFEESGLRVVDPVYLGSQPWPFPASLMMGFTARLDSERVSSLTPDGTEIIDLRWFSRDDLVAALPDILLPGRTSIARAIIELWFGAEIDDVG